MKREGAFALMDVGVVDDGSGEGYEALFKRLEKELDGESTGATFLLSLGFALPVRSFIESKLTLSFLAFSRCSF